MLINIGSAPDDGTGDPLRDAFQAINNLYTEDSLTFASTISWDVTASPVARVILTGDATIEATNITDGRSAILVIEQDATGGRELTFGAGFSSPGGTPPTVAQGPAEVTLVAGFATGGALVVDADGVQAAGYTSLAYNATVSWDVEDAPNINVPLDGDLTLDATQIPSTVQSGIIKLVQDATGGRTVTFGTGFTAEGGGAPAISTGANEITYLYYAVDPQAGTVVIAETAGGSSLPTGGTTGQVLEKASNTDGDVQWGDPATGGSATKTLGTTASAANVTIDFDGDGIQTITVDQNIELSTTNRSDGATGKEVQVHLVSDGTGTAHNLTFAADVNVADSVPATIPDGGAVIITLLSTGGDEAQTIAMVLSQHATWDTSGSVAVSPQIATYRDAVNGARSTNLADTQLTNLNEFWERLGNRDAELSADRQANALGLWTLRSTQNADQGASMYALVGENLSLMNGPGFDPLGMVFDGTNWLETQSQILTGSPVVHAIAVWERQDTGNNAYLLSQYGGTDSAGDALFLTDSSSDEPAMGLRVSGNFQGTTTEGNESWPLNAFSYYSCRVTYGNDGQALFNQAGTRIDVTTPKDTTGFSFDKTDPQPFRIGNREDGTRGVVGRAAFAAVFTGDITTDLGAIGTIYQQTIGQGLGL